MAHSAVLYIRVVATIFEVFGLSLTAWRVYFRLKIGRFWWEDAWAAILLATGIVWLVAWWMHPYTDGLTSIVAAWFDSLGFTCIVTLARMSVLFSIIRIVHGRPQLLKFTYACVVYFVACWIILILVKVIQCASNSSWHHVYTWGGPSCVVETPISIFQFTNDCIAAFILVVIPVHMLWRIKLPGRQKRMILSIFASSVALAFGSLFHVVGQIMGSSVILTAGYHVEVALSIIVCNLLVVVTFMHRYVLRDAYSSASTAGSAEDSSDDDFTTQARPTAAAETALPLTTVDLDISLTSSGIIKSGRS